MQVTVNGQSETIRENTTVAEFLEARDLQPVRVAVEINEELVRRSRFSETKIRPGDRIEVVTFVGGG